MPSSGHLKRILKYSPILILDEPTAHLALQIEKQVLETLFETMRGKTSLLITHRLVGLENVEEILVMEDSQIVERGSHAALLMDKGLYRRLWDIQNQILSDPTPVFISQF